MQLTTYRAQSPGVDLQTDQYQLSAVVPPSLLPCVLFVPPLICIPVSLSLRWGELEAGRTMIPLSATRKALHMFNALWCSA